MDGLLISRLSDKEKKRQEVIFEMIETERDYLRDLDMIVEVAHGAHRTHGGDCSVAWPNAGLNSVVSVGERYGRRRRYCARRRRPQNYLNPIRTKKMLTAKDTMVIFSIIEMLMPVNQVRKAQQCEHGASLRCFCLVRTGGPTGHPAAVGLDGLAGTLGPGALAQLGGAPCSAPHHLPSWGHSDARRTSAPGARHIGGSDPS